MVADHVRWMILREIEGPTSMQEILSHRVSDDNDNMVVEAIDIPDSNGIQYAYGITWNKGTRGESCVFIPIRNKQEDATAGLTVESLLAVVEHHLRAKNDARSSLHLRLALEGIDSALSQLEKYAKQVPPCGQ